MPEPEIGLPTWGQLMLPLIDTLAKTGPAPAKTACQAVADTIELDPNIRKATATDATGRTFNLFDRRLRWVRQSALGRGLLASPQRGIWQLSEVGEEIAAAKERPDSPNIRRGTIVTLYQTLNGKFLWGYAEDVIASLENQSLDLVFTSPPYPLFRKKEYGNLSGAAYLDWLEDLLGLHIEKLTPHGGILLNLGETYEKQNSPQISTYREEITLRAKKNLGLALFGKYYWQNPCKPPAGHWVTHAKCRPKNDTEEILWLAPESNTPQYFGDAARRPYSQGMQRHLKEGGDQRKKRPSGHGDAKNGFASDLGGSWPTQSLRIPNAHSQGPYFTFCRNHQLPIHPARFPDQLAETLIKTHTQTNQTVFDPFGGSGTTAAIAEKLERRWISCERDLAYAIGSLGRFTAH